MQEKLKASYEDRFRQAVKRLDSDSSAMQIKAFNTFNDLEKVGHTRCLKYLAMCYYSGTGCNQDYDKAREYYTITIALGLYNADPKPSSYEMLRNIDEEKMDVIYDAERIYASEVKTDKHLKEMYLGFVNTIAYGAEKGLAYLRLGRLYFDGVCVEQNRLWAIYYYRRAFEVSGMYSNPGAEAAFNLGMIFYKGDGISLNRELAKFYFSRAYYGYSSLGNSEAEKECEYYISDIGEFDTEYMLKQGDFPNVDYVDEDEFLAYVTYEWRNCIPDYTDL